MLRPAVLIRNWSPRVLQPSLWLEARAGHMFASNAGSGDGVVDGGTVGYWRDQSGNGFDLSSTADDTTRPTWNVNGGIPYVSFDGSNDVLRRTASLGLYAAGACSVFAAVRGNPSLDTYLLAEGGSGGNNPIYRPLGSGAAGTTFGSFLRNDAGTVIVTNANVPIANAFDNTDRVVGLIDDGAVQTSYVNVNTRSAAFSYVRSGTLTLDRLGLGALVRAAVSGFFATRLYAIVAVKRPLTDSERQRLTRYLGGRAGIGL